MTTDFLFILDVESFHIVPASSSCGGVCFGQPERQIWEKGETMENSRRSRGRSGPFWDSGDCQKSLSTYEVGTHSKSL